MPAWQHHAHYLTQYSMYALFFIVPLAGWAYSSAAGYPVVVFGVFPLPDFVPANEALAESIKPLHEYTAMALALLIMLHVAAALKHQWWDKHALLQRMWPRR
jgi:cytochrome b561